MFLSVIRDMKLPIKTLELLHKKTASKERTVPQMRKYLQSAVAHATRHHKSKRFIACSV